MKNYAGEISVVIPKLENGVEYKRNVWRAEILLLRQWYVFEVLMPWN